MHLEPIEVFILDLVIVAVAGVVVAERIVIIFSWAKILLYFLFQYNYSWGEY